MHKNSKILNNKKMVKKISILGFVINFLLAILKFGVGIFSKSQAMISDSLHSLEDMFSCILTLIGVKISFKGKDNLHPLGYGKSEYIMSFIISIFMIIAAFTMVKETISSVYNNVSVYPNIWLILICVINIFVKLCFYIYINCISKKNSNILIRVSKVDQRNDILICLSILVSTILGYYGIHMFDSIISILIALWIFFSAVNLFRVSYNILIDKNLNNDKLDVIKKSIKTYNEVKDILFLFAKPIGQKYIIIVNIKMDKDKSLESIHLINKQIKEEILRKYEYVQDVIIMVNPY